MNEMELTIPTPRGDIFAIYTEGDASESMCQDDDSGRGPKPLVILCHGLMMNCRQVLQLSLFYRKATKTSRYVKKCFLDCKMLFSVV